MNRQAWQDHLHELSKVRIELAREKSKFYDYLDRQQRYQLIEKLVDNDAKIYR